MYHSNRNGNCDDPIPYSDHSFFNHGHFATDSKQDEDPNSLSFFNFPSPNYYNQCELDDVFLLHNQTLMPESVSDTNINMPGSSKNDDSAAIDCTKKATEVQQSARKRSSSKRDRHSKINTANGPRDRRMRLSLDVARQFFGLRDMLGFDKASRTVEWLLIQARQEIKKLKLTRAHVNNSVAIAAKSPSSTSEGEVVSALGQPTMMIEKKVTRQAPRSTSFHPLARDLREKARERAKARTKAKKLCGETMNNDLNNGHNNPSLFQATIAEVKDLSSRDIERIRIHHGDMIDEPLPIINKWSPNPMFNCLQNSGINQEHQFTGFLSFGKPWEAYN